MNQVIKQDLGGYRVGVSIVGVVPVLHHAFGPDQLAGLQKKTERQAGHKDYSGEWMQTMFITEDGYVGQPASHILGSLLKVAGRFPIPGKGGKKSYKDHVKAWVYITPEMIPHLEDGRRIPAPDEGLLYEPTEMLSVSIMRVVVGRGAAARQRLMVAAGWRLDFIIDVLDGQFPADVLREILVEAGRSAGIGDFRPRYGRYELERFEVMG